MIRKTKFYINGEWVDPVQNNQLKVINLQMKAFAQ